MRRPFTLIPSKGSADTGRCIEALVEGHRQHKVIGLAYVVLYSGRHYDVHLCGEADRSPTFARGAVSVLDDLCRQRIHGGG